MRLGLIFVLLIVLLSFQLGQDLNEIDIPVRNITRGLNWDNITSNDFEINTSYEKADRVGNVIRRGVDFMGFAGFEISKASIEYGYDNPNADFEGAFTYVQYILICMIIIAIIPIIPYVIGLIYVIFVFIKRFVIWANKRYRIYISRKKAGY